MQSLIQHLITKVETARAGFISSTEGLSYQQVSFRMTDNSWSITQIVEHMVWAERAGVIGMWRAVEGYRNNRPIWSGTPVHHHLSIEQIVEKTWKTKENVPDVARPHWGEPIAFWISELRACSATLKNLGEAIGLLNPEEIIYPHPISGPLNVVQRLEFLRFHLERHQNQMEQIKTSPDFPAR